MTEQTQTAPPAEDLDAKILASLQELEGGPEQEEQPVEARVEPPQEAPEQQETAAEPEGQAPPEQGDAAYEKAVKALRFLGMGTKDLEVLGRDRVVALGEKEASRSAEFSTKLNEKDAQIKAAAAQAKPAEPPKGQPHDFSARTKPLAKVIGDDEVEEHLSALASDILGEANSQIGELRSTVQALSSALLDIHVKAARDRLPDHTRKLADDATLEKSLRPKIETLLATGAYNSIEDAVRDAAAIVLGPKILEGDVSARAAIVRAREKGSTSPMNGRPGASGTMSLDDRALASLQALERGEGDMAARSAFQGF